MDASKGPRTAWNAKAHLRKMHQRQEAPSKQESQKHEHVEGRNADGDRLEKEF